MSQTNVDPDALFSTPASKKENVPADNSGLPGDLVFAGNTQPKKKAQQAGPTDVKLVYDKYLKRLYLFDVSGSMRSAMVSNENVDSFDWNYPSLASIRNSINAARQEVANAQAVIVASGDPDNAPGISDLVDPYTLALAEVDPAADTDDKVLKCEVVAKALWHGLGMSPKRNLTSRLDVVQTSAKNLIAKRYDNYPDADVIALWFDTHVGVLGQPEGTITLRRFTKDEVLGGIALLKSCGHTGGTNILNAINTALEIFDKAPSPLQLHQIILVTDAEDGSGPALWEMRKLFQDKGVVLDFIHIQSPYNNEQHYAKKNGYTPNAEYLIRLCKLTGGDYTPISKANDFETVMLAASSRLLLPPGV